MRALRRACHLVVAGQLTRMCGNSDSVAGGYAPSVSGCGPQRAPLDADREAGSHRNDTASTILLYDMWPERSGTRSVVSMTPPVV
eukprot:scaffold13315_cov115-Isochrysis_galbana.AAC.8